MAESSDAASTSAVSSSALVSHHFISNYILRGSALLHIVYGRFRPVPSLDIIFGKGTSLELVEVTENGHLHTLCDQPVFASINEMATVPQKHGEDLLLFISDFVRLSFLRFSNERKRFFPLRHVQLWNVDNVELHHRRLLAVDSSGLFAAVSAYKDQLVLFSLSTSSSGDIIDKENKYPSGVCGTIQSMCFISRNSSATEEHNRVLAVIVNRNNSLSNELLLLKWNIQNQTIELASKFVNTDLLLHEILDVPHCSGFALLFSIGTVHLMHFRNLHEPCVVYRASLTDAEEKSEKSFGNISKHISSSSWQPDNGSPRLVACLDTGEVVLLEVSIKEDGSKVSVFDFHCTIPSCKTLKWIKGSFVAALVSSGDGLLLKIEDKRLIQVRVIENVSPVSDMFLLDHEDEEDNHICVSCGLAPEGSIRIIERSKSVEELLLVSSSYAGITGIWMLKTDGQHFIVLSFLERTSVFSFDVTFHVQDVTDSVSFKDDICTLACGVIANKCIIQIHCGGVQLCTPDSCTSWIPSSGSIILGAVGRNLVVACTHKISYVIGLCTSSSRHELFEMGSFKLQAEVSCVSIPQFDLGPLCSLIGFHVDNIFVSGTWAASVEVLSFLPGMGLRVIASGMTSLDASVDREFVPDDVRLIVVDRLYVLVGLRNGMILQFYWPMLPVERGAFSEDTIDLRLAVTRYIGVQPVLFVSLNDSSDSDVIALGSRPWLLKTSKRGLCLNSISVQYSTQATSFCSAECPNGIVFVENENLHLVELVHKSDKLNVLKYKLEGTPKKLLYHGEKNLLLVMRTDLGGDLQSSDLCCINPTDCSMSRYELEQGETCKSMEFVKVGSKQVVAVGTSLAAGLLGEPFGVMGIVLASGPPFVLSGDVGSTMGRLLIFVLEQEETGLCNLRLAAQVVLPGNVLAICTYDDHQFLASAGNTFYVWGFQDNDPGQLRRHAEQNIEHDIVSLTAKFERICVGDCMQGISLFSYIEDQSELRPIYQHPFDGLVADCLFLDPSTVAVSDRKGYFYLLSDNLKDNTMPMNTSFYIGEIASRIKVSAAEVIATTLLGSVIAFSPIPREDYEILKSVEARLAKYPLTAPVSGNGHKEFRSQENMVGEGSILDGDMLAQFLELTIGQREQFLSSPPLFVGSAKVVQLIDTYLLSL